MKRDELFEVLEPPPGGLTRLRARMKAPVKVRWWVPLGVVAAGVAVLVAVPAREPTVDLWSQSRFWFTAGPPVVRGEGGTGVREVSSSPGVLFVRVSTLDRED